VVAVLCDVVFYQSLEEMFCYNSISQYQDLCSHEKTFKGSFWNFVSMQHVAMHVPQLSRPLILP